MENKSSWYSWSWYSWYSSKDIVVNYINGIEGRHFSSFMVLYNTRMREHLGLEDRFVKTNITEKDIFVRKILGVLNTNGIKLMAYIIEKPFEDLPLYINDDSVIYSVTANWRIQIGR